MRLILWRVVARGRRAGGGYCEGREYWTDNRGCNLRNLNVEIMMIGNDERHSLSNELLVADFDAFDEILAA